RQLRLDLRRGLGRHVDQQVARRLVDVQVLRHHCRASVCSGCGSALGACAWCFFCQSAMAALIASSASTEQWIFTGGSASSFAICVFLMVSASSTDLPFTHSVTSEEEAIAEPQPKVLKRASSILPSSLIFSSSRITS